MTHDFLETVIKDFLPDARNIKFAKGFIDEQDRMWLVKAESASMGHIEAVLMDTYRYLDNGVAIMTGVNRFVGWAKVHGGICFSANPSNECKWQDQWSGPIYLAYTQIHSMDIKYPTNDKAIVYDIAKRFIPSIKALTIANYTYINDLYCYDLRIGVGGRSCSETVLLFGSLSDTQKITQAIKCVTSGENPLFWFSNNGTIRINSTNSEKPSILHLNSPKIDCAMALISYGKA